MSFEEADREPSDNVRSLGFRVSELVAAKKAPIRKIIGDLSNTERVLVGLEVRPNASHARDDAETGVRT